MVPLPGFCIPWTFICRLVDPMSVFVWPADTRLEKSHFNWVWRVICFYTIVAPLHLIAQYFAAEQSFCVL